MKKELKKILKQMAKQELKKQKAAKKLKNDYKKLNKANIKKHGRPFTEHMNDRDS